MKKFYKLMVTCCIALTCYITPANSADFIEGLEDVPMISGLKQIQSDNISFGNEQTRFVEAYFTSKTIKFNKVVKFYQETLPQLGWKFVSKKENTLQFKRDIETLDIVKEKTSPLLIRITLKSKY